MLFVSLCKFKAGKEHEGTTRRMQWQHPEGSQVVAEYWLQTNDPAVIVVFEADSVAQIMAAIGPWSDIFDTTVVPAITAEEGLTALQQLMPQMPDDAANTSGAGA